MSVMNKNFRISIVTLVLNGALDRSCWCIHDDVHVKDKS